ncbi:hypothetical protein PENTCL1PPCAC_10093, partial [Pristionchus entomophagus]
SSAISVALTRERISTRRCSSRCHLGYGLAIAALSYFFVKSDHEHILQGALSRYRQSASIAADYGMSDVFDNLAINLCKFSTLMTAAERAGDDSVGLQRKRAIAAAA